VLAINASIEATLLVKKVEVAVVAEEVGHLAAKSSY